MDFETLRARVLQPVTALNPLGGDIRLDERFDAIRSEIQAWESLESETHPDWKRLSEACCHLLASESKDILLLCWLAYAWGQHVPERGVTEACLILGEALTEWGEGVHPGRKRKRALCMAVDWLASRWLSEEAFSGQDVNEAVLAQVKAVSAWLEPLGADSDHAWYTWAAQVRKALQSRMARAVSATETVKTASMAPAGVPPDSHAAAVSDPEASADIPAPAVTSPVPPIVSAPASAGIHSAETLVKAHRSGQSFIESLCDYLRHKSLLDANAYLMARTYAFSGVVSLPPSREGVTELRPVPDEKRHKLEALAAAGEWAACIHELERSLFRLPFWLTGHRMVAEALEKLGGSGVAQLIQALCHAWVERFPALTDYRFKGGEVHFADARTRQWLSRTGVSTRVEAAPQSPVPQQRGGQADKAHELPDVSALDTPDALRTLAQAAAGEPEPRRQLDIWLAQGELARERGETPLASAIGRGVLAQLDRQPAGYFLRTEKMKALALAAGAPLEIRPELSELSLCQPHIAQQLINHM